MQVGEILDRAKSAQGIETDMALAKALGVGRSAVSSWRHGTRLPDTVQCATLAGLAGIPLAQVLGIVGEARAISREEKAVWRKLAATAALLLIVAFPSLPGHAATLGQPEIAAVRTHDYANNPLCIMRTVRTWTWRLARWLARLIFGGRDAHLLAL